MKKTIEFVFIFIFTTGMVCFSTHTLLTASDELLSEDITSGYVIVDGKYLKAPYKVELRNYKLYINGVSCRNIGKTKNRDDKIVNLDEQCRKIYHSLKNKANEEEKQNKIEEYLKKNDILNYKVKSSKLGVKYIVILNSDGSEGDCIYYDLPTKEMYQEYKKYMDELLNSYYKALVNDSDREAENVLLKMLERYNKSGIIDFYEKKNLGSLKIRFLNEKYNEIVVLADKETAKEILAGTLKKRKEEEWENNAKQEFNNFVDALKRNCLLIFYGNWGSVSSNNEFQKIVGIVNSDKSNDKKLEELKEIVHEKDAAEALLEKFSQ